MGAAKETIEEFKFKQLFAAMEKFEKTMKAGFAESDRKTQEGLARVHKRLDGFVSTFDDKLNSQIKISVKHEEQIAMLKDTEDVQRKTNQWAIATYIAFAACLATLVGLLYAVFKF